MSWHQFKMFVGEGFRLQGYQVAETGGGNADGGPSVEAEARPLCAKPMVRHTAKRGATAGNEFWGCTAYRSCRGTRPIN